MVDKNIDGGKAFDWGRVSAEYAKFRDIYPDLFYEKIANRGVCIKGQKVLDLGTGTGVLPRNMYHYEAAWTGIDVSANQIEQAIRLAAEQKMKIEFMCRAAEELSFPARTFDVVTACQCFWYFDEKIVAPMLSNLLKENGKLLILYMAWLPFEDDIAGKSEELVLKYSPQWSGAGERIHPISVDNEVLKYFEVAYQEEYLLDVPFTRETWHGRMKACRGVGASLTERQLEKWEREHRELLEQIAPEKFTVKHYAAMLELDVKKENR